MNIDILATGSSGNCYLVESSNTKILIECGIPIKQIRNKLKFNIATLDGCLVTHEHMDHAKSVKDLVKIAINVYATKGTFKALNIDNHRAKIIKSNEYFNVNNLQILPFNTVHDANEPVGYFIKDTNTNDRLMFITDTAYLEYKIPNVNYLMIECNYIKEKLDNNVEKGIVNASLRNRIVRNHMSLETVLKVLESINKSKLRRIYILHLSDSNSDEIEIKEEIQKATGIEVVVA